MPSSSDQSKSTYTVASLNKVHWVLGHFVFLFFSLSYLLCSFRIFYRVGLLGLAFSLALEIYQICMSPPANSSFLEKLIVNEKTPYLYLIVVMYLFTPSTALLVPLVIRSLYSFLGQAKLTPLITKSAYWKSYLSGPVEHLLASQNSVMDFISHLEILSVPWLIGSLMFVGPSLIWAIMLRKWQVLIPTIIRSIYSSTPILILAYGSFLRWQYLVSPKSRAAWGVWDEMIWRLISHPSCPKQVKAIYQKIKDALKVWGVKFADANVKPTKNVDSSAHPVRRQY